MLPHLTQCDTSPMEGCAPGRLSLQTHEQTHLLGETSLGTGPRLDQIPLLQNRSHLDPRVYLGPESSLVSL